MSGVRDLSAVIEERKTSEQACVRASAFVEPPFELSASLPHCELARIELSVLGASKGAETTEEAWVDAVSDLNGAAERMKSHQVAGRASITPFCREKSNGAATFRKHTYLSYQYIGADDTVECIWRE